MKKKTVRKIVKTTKNIKPKTYPPGMHPVELALGANPLQSLTDDAAKILAVINQETQRMRGYIAKREEQISQLRKLYQDTLKAWDDKSVEALREINSKVRAFKNF